MKKKNLAICCGMALALGVGICGVSTTSLTARADWVDYELHSTYAFNSTFDVPTIRIKVGASQYTAENVIKFPDGTATNAKSIKLDQTGTYTIRSSKEVNGKVYTLEKQFSVTGNYYNYGEGSYACYGESNAPLRENGVFTYDYSAPAGQKYLFVSLAQGDTLTFSPYIDVSSLTKTDETPFISTFVLPAVVGVYDFDHLIYTLTDSEDSNVTLSFMLNRVTSNADMYRMTTYVMGYGNGQAPTGADYKDAQINSIHVSDGWGTPLNHSFIKYDSTGNEFDPSTQSVNFWYDTADTSVWVKSYGGAIREVADMDDPTFFGTMWNGFPSGKARLSVTATDFNGTRKANFCIKSVNGLDLSQDIFIDSNAPVIDVQSEYDVVKMPEGKVGNGYPVPVATAKDDYDGVRSVKTSVYFDYNGENTFNVDVKDGYFYPDRAGVYAIVYTATDTNGNEAKTVLYVHVGGAIEELKIELPAGRAEEGVLGSVVDILTPEVLGGSGNKVLKTYVCQGDDEYEIIDGKFRLEHEGGYTVKYIATDFIGQTVENSYRISTQNGSKSVFVDEIVLPKVLASGQKYVLPTYYLNDYTSGSLVRKVASFRITDANGEKVYEAGQTYIPKIDEDEGSVSVELFDTTVGKTVVVPTFIPYTQRSATAVAQVKFDRYFYTNEFSKTKSSSGIVFSANQNYEDTSITFANSLIARIFRLDLKNFTGSFKEIVFTLEDVNDPTNKISATIEKQGRNGVFKVGSSSIVVRDIFTASGLSIGFNKDNCFTLGNVKLPAVDELGNAFEGFSAEKVYFSMNVKNVLSGASFTVNRVCSHTLSSASNDMFIPQIVILGNYGGTYDLGDTYTVAPAISGDEFTINVSFSLKVTAPDGTIAKDINGVELKEVDPFKTYQIKLDQYGQYFFDYYAKELDFGPTSMALDNKLRYQVNVTDTEAPVVTIKSYVKSFKVGDEIKVPVFTVTDNISTGSDITVKVYVYSPQGILTEVSKGMRFAYAGTYEFRILAMDAEGNVCLERVQVQVK